MWKSVNNLVENTENHIVVSANLITEWCKTEFYNSSCKIVGYCFVKFVNKFAWIFAMQSSFGVTVGYDNK